jgi:predicted DNA-binding ribbon-helix-helix protein
MNEEFPVTTLRIELSDWHANQLRELAARENITAEALAAKIIGEAIAQADYFERLWRCL